MSTARSNHTATRLGDGRVLVAGGTDRTGAATASAEIYDPATRSFKPTGGMAEARAAHHAVLLPDGRVLVVGGDSTGSAEIYDPASATFAATAAMAAPRHDFTATLLASGLVLVTGGAATAGGTVLASAEVFDPAGNGGAGSFSQAAAMTAPRAGHSATLLASGEVLIAGGSLGRGLDLDTAELFDPVAARFIPFSSRTHAASAGHRATLLPSGRVLLTGGAGSAEVFDPTTAAFSAAGAPTAGIAAAALLLPTGRVLVVSGAGAELFDPSSALFARIAPPAAPRTGAAMLLLDDGHALVTGGADPASGEPLASAELYTPDPVRAYVPTDDGTAVAVIDTATGAVVEKTPVAAGAAGVALDPAGTRVYVTSAASGTLAVIDTATGAVIATVPLGEGAEPMGVAVSPDGARVYVASHRSGSVSVVDTATSAVTAILAVGPSLVGAAAQPAGTEVYLTGAAGVSVVEPLVAARSHDIAVGGGSYGVAVSPDGRRVWVALASGELAVIDAGKKIVVGAIAVGAGPRGVAVTPDGARVYVANRDDGSVSVVDAAAGAVIATVAVGAEPEGAAVAPDGRRVYVVNSGSGDVSVLDVASHSVVATIAVGVHPRALGAFVGAVAAPDHAAAVADLSVTNTPGAHSVANGAALSYTLTVRNAGPSTATSVTLHDALPAGASFLRAGASQGACTGPVARAGGAVACRLGSLDNGQSARVTVSVTVTAAAGQLVNTVGVGSATRDPDASNNAATATVAVTADGASAPGGTTAPASSIPIPAPGTPAGVRPGTVPTLAGPTLLGGNPAAPDGAITGTVTDTAQPTPNNLSGVTVDVFDATTGAFVAGSTATTDVNGIYTTIVLTPGAYKVRARLATFATTWFNGQRTQGDGNPVYVTGTAHSVADIAMAPAGGITGTITDGVNPLSGVAVDIFDASTNAFVAGAFITATGGICGATACYNTGRILAPGNYKVRARAATFATVFASGKRSFIEANAIAVSAGADTTTNFAMSPGGGVTGTVTRADNNQPITGVSIDIFDANTNGIESGFVTNASGVYTTQRRLPPGIYKVRARAPGFATTINKATRTLNFGFELVTVPAGADAVVNFSLVVGGDITGTVRDCSSNLLAGAIVDIGQVGTNDFIDGGFTTNASGVYTTGSRLAPGQYMVGVRKVGFGKLFYGGTISFPDATPVTIATVGQVQAGIDVTLPCGAGFNGAVTLSGQPVAGALVDVFEAAHNTVPFGAFRTNALGLYDTGRNYPPGSYKLRARAPGVTDTFYDGGAGAIDVVSAPSVAVGASSDTTLNVAVAAGGIISGTIRERGTNLPIAGATVTTFRLTSLSYLGSGTAVTDGNGNFSLGGLHDGEWLVRAEAAGHIIAYYSGNPNNPSADRDAATTVVIHNASVVPASLSADINLAAGGGVIRGFITRSDNSQPPLPGAQVQVRLYPRTSFITSVAITEFNLCPDPLIPAQQCNYMIPNLGAGSYQLETFASVFDPDTAIGWYPLPPASALGQASRGTALPVTLSGGGTTQVDFQVPAFAGGGARSITGFLKDTNGVPIKFAEIGVLEAGGLAGHRFVTPNGDGSFSINHLPPGKYLVRADTDTESPFVASFYGLDTTQPGSPQPYAEPLSSAAAVIVVTAAADPPPIEIRLPGNPATITGTISRVCPSEDPSGCTQGALVGIMGANISAQNFFGNGVFGATTRADGSYIVRGLPAGSYKVRVSAPGPGFITRFYRCDSGECALSTGTALTFDDGTFKTVVAGQQVTNVSMILDPGGGSITGTVRGPGNVPVVAALVQAREATSGAAVITVVSAADGTYIIPQLATGNYKLRVSSSKPGFVTQWYSNKPSREEADAVSVTAPATTTNKDFLVSTNEGTFSGQITDNGIPVAGAGVLAYDTSGRFIRAAGVVGKDGKYMLVGLPPGSYIAQARGLGYASNYLGGVPDLGSAQPFAITVLAGVDQPGKDFNLTLTSDIRGTISYTGQQTGALQIGLFRDAALTQQLYGLTVPSPTFPYAYRFSKAPSPDSLGILPSAVLPGAYYVGAFIDSNPNSAQDAIEPSGKFGGATATQVVVTEGATVVGANITLIDGVSTAGTTSSAKSVPQVIVEPAGNPGAGLGDIRIVENGTGALSAAGRVQVTLPQGLTFVGTPAVATDVSNGLTIRQGGPANAACPGATAPAVDGPGRIFSFAVCQKSSTGPALIGIAAMTVNVPAGFVADGDPCPPIDPPSNRVCVRIDSSISNGLTSASFQIAGFAPPSPVPVLSGVSIVAVGQGVIRDVVLTGQNFTLLDFANGDTIDFGPGITVVPGSIVVNSDTQITLRIQVDPGAQLGTRSVTITDSPGDVKLVLTDVLTVDPPPTITSAGIGLNGTDPLRSPFTGDNLKGQTVLIKGSNFQSPPGLVVQFSGTGIAVDPSTIACDPCPTQVTVRVIVDKGAELDPSRTVTVINPDLGMVTSSAAGSFLAIALASPEAPSGEAPRAQVTPPPPPPPTVSNTVPSAARTGANVTINGSGFGSTLSAVTATFAGPNGTRVAAKVNSVSGGVALSVQVPGTAVDGLVTVAVSGVQSSTSAGFVVTNPLLSAVSPASGVQTNSVIVNLTGAKLQAGTTVAFNPPADLSAGPVTLVDAAHIQATVKIGAAAALGLRDVTVTNPDGASSTLAQAFEVKLNTPVTLALALKSVPAKTPINLGDFLPGIDGLQVTLDSTGKCTSRSITPTVYLLEATVAGTLTPPPTLTFKLTSSALTGTASNDDCEPNVALSLPPESDFSIGIVNAAPNVASQQAVALHVGGGLYQAWLASWDRGGTVRIDVTDSLVTPTVSGSLTLPADTDRDGLPDGYEKNGPMNPGKTCVNVLDSQKADVNGNGVPDGQDKFAADGLTNFDKYRGVYLVSPAKGGSGTLSTHVRLCSGMRNLFVRGRGFATDPALPSGMCGVDSATGTPVLKDPTVPCPVFQVGGAFAEIGIQIWDVTSSFNPAGTTVFPTRSLADPTKPMLDLATVTYDAANCSGGAACDHTSKLGTRQWNFPTLGFSTFGSPTLYGTALVLAKPLKAYFNDRPYRHKEDFPGAFLPTPPGGKPMLAPITIVCDKSSQGADNGLVQTGECTVSGTLGGDIYVPGAFDRDMTVMDVNNDGCVELPFVSDPTTLTTCSKDAESAVSPQATFQQVTRSIVTHELGHAAGVNLHTSDSTDLMYQYSINWTRDGHFSPQAAGLVQIHNKGKQ